MKKKEGREGNRGQRVNTGTIRATRGSPILSKMETPGWFLRLRVGPGKAALLYSQKPQGTRASIINLFQAGLGVWGGHSGALKYSDNQEKEGVLN